MQPGNPRHRQGAGAVDSRVGQVLDRRHAPALRGQADSRPVGQVAEAVKVVQVHPCRTGQHGGMLPGLVREPAGRHYDPPCRILRHYRGVELLHYGPPDRAVRLVLALDDRLAAVVPVYDQVPAAVGHPADPLDAPPAGAGKNVGAGALELEPVDHVEVYRPAGRHGAGAAGDPYSPCTAAGQDLGRAARLGGAPPQTSDLAGRHWARRCDFQLLREGPVAADAAPGTRMCGALRPEARVDLKKGRFRMPAWAEVKGAARRPWRARPAAPAARRAGLPRRTRRAGMQWPALALGSPASQSIMPPRASSRAPAGGAAGAP